MATSFQPYNVTVLKPGYYYFSNDRQIEYVCFFSSFDYLFKDYPAIASKTFSFNLELVNKDDLDKQKGTDKKLALTVVSIIKEFLESKINAVVYVCDNTDNRHAVRFEKFTGWFDDYDNGDYIQVTGYVKAYDVEYYNALLIHKDNKLKNSFIRAFQELNDQTPK